jgi:hypothetical protein|tara:strand:- start:4 stop:633 length:630 start_codon:yes stop_codon:yes gene_type:complete
MNKTFTLTLLLMAFIIGCIPDDEPLYNCEDPIPEYRLDEDFKAYFDFQPGTYWVYEDSLSGESDSVYIISNEREIKEGISGRGCDARYNNETFFIEQIKSDTIEKLTASTTFTGRGYMFINSSLTGSHFYMKKNGQSPGKNNIHNLAEIEEISFNNINFKDIIILQKTTRVNLQDIETSILWWAKDVGLIRIEFESGRVQRIKNYNIIK